MPFCSNCGQEIDSNARFCSGCGTLLNDEEQSEKQRNEEQLKEEKKPEDSLKKQQPQQSTYSERKQEYAGRVIKCPVCGAELPSFTAICPDCGHEVNSQHVSSSVKEFIDAINEYDNVIANDSEPPKTGWKAWSKGKRVIWVVLNIITSFIPLVVYLAFQLIKPVLLPNSVPVLSADEKRKATLIENYAFPNEREATIEALMFTKSKMAFLASEKLNKKTLYWANLWNTKAEQLNQRANIILKGDKIVESTYADITASKSKVDRIVKVRAIIGAVIIVVFLAFVLINGSLFKGIGSIFDSSHSSVSDTYDDADYNSTYEWPNSGLSTYLPLPETEYGKIRTDNEDRFSIDLYKVTQEHFENYVKQCKAKGFTLHTTKTDSVFYSYNADKYSLNMIYDKDKQELSLYLDVPEKMAEINWPSSTVAKQVPVPETLVGRIWSDTSDSFGVNIDNVNQSAFSAYVDACMKKGFTVDYAREDDFFKAFNKDGYELTIHLKVFNVMEIHVEIPSED